MRYAHAMDGIKIAEGGMAVGVSGGRRAFAVATLVCLGLLLLAMAAVAPPASLPLLGFLVAAALAALALAVRLHAATATGLVYADGVLRERGGRVIARIEDIEGVDRGTFAFKPSNGFLMTLRRGAPGARAWAPGLWWRVGRRVGIGGVMRAAESRALAELLSLQVAARRGP